MSIYYIATLLAIIEFRAPEELLVYGTVPDIFGERLVSKIS
jgi:hypothetical protein